MPSMKLLFTIIFFSMIRVVLTAQLSYTPFPTQAVRWNCNYSEVWELANHEYGEADESSYFTVGDTLINGYLYTVLSGTNIHTSTDRYIPTNYMITNTTFSPAGGFAAYRNDSVNKKVYILYGNTEKVLYDFDVQVGDTIECLSYDTANGWYCNHGWPPGTISVTSIDSVLIDNTYRIRINFSDGFGSSIIAGVGSTCGLFNPIGIFMDWFGGTLECLSVTSHNIYSVVSGPCEILEIDEKSNRHSVTVYPNPANDHILINDMMEATDYSIFDSLGRLIKEGKTLNQIDLNGMENGLYNLVLKTKPDEETHIISIVK
jgi:hypothetical protein